MSEQHGVRPATERELARIKPLLRLMSRIHTAFFRLSGGRLGRRFMRGAPVGLLTTTGRRSGAPRTLPLIYLADGDRLVLVASQGGAVRHPLWYLNLQADPEVQFQTAASPRKYRARTCSEEERERFWPRLCAIYRDYDDYQRRTDRRIPVVVLEPV